ncbi:xanthine dehydrogenase family protein molybdopterin-binding subunit [Georgenia alba]|uniref:Xanthine dehydrogenase family protein molybdopterin-binding subunit n=1 Tax=Georgenia alba TaxID=2233858 RepID=A0ABW2Q8J1_9MICO
MTETFTARAVGTSTARLDGPVKVSGTARYAYEQSTDRPAHLYPVLATVARGTITAMHTQDAEALDGVLAVLTPWNAPRLADTTNRDLTVLQSPEVDFRNQIVGAVIATSPEVAREAASLVRVEYDEKEHDAEFRPDHPERYAPEDADAAAGDLDAALAAAEVVVDQRYSTPEEHNNPMEPHATVAVWDPDGPLLTLHSSTQGTHVVRKSLAPVLGLEPEQIRVIAPYVGGGFGAKGAPHAHDVLAALAARVLPGRAVKFPVTRQQSFVFVGHRPATAQRVRLAARSDGTLTAVAHDSVSSSARIGEYLEQAASTSRTMYGASVRHTSHRVVPLDVPVPFWMRAPGEAPGMFALEVAMDELAAATGVDPVELRVRNDPPRDPDTGNAWTSRRLVECLREGADWFGWEGRDPAPGTRRNGEWMVGTGVASAMYPHNLMPGTKASVRYDGEGRYTVRVGAADIGTGAWTTLALISADALEVPVEQIAMEIGDSALPPASVAGGSSGTSSWGAAIVSAARTFRDQHGPDPAPGTEVTAPAADRDTLEGHTAHSFGAHFVEAWVQPETGQVRVPRMRSVFSIGRVVNPRTVRSQFLGGMTMGLSMALHEHSVRDPRFGHVVTQDLATYHVPVNADVEDMDARWLDEVDDRATPMGSRGAGEIGIVGVAAAVVNAVHHATGRRVRDLPVTPARLLGA